MNERESRTEIAFTELFHRLPLEPTPLGFRDAVMSRISVNAARSSRWEWILAALVALPSLAFVVWNVMDNGDEIAAALGMLANALLGIDEWDASSSVYVDGVLLVAIALVGVAGLLVTHALLSDEQQRSRTLAA
jgi:hypothetical protein